MEKPRPILLKNGLIVDGTGNKGYIGDVLIQEDKIREVSSMPIDCVAETIDCTGKVIAPGFIDIHSHMDGPLAFKGLDQIKTPFIAQGITTFVAGNCGMSAGSIRKGNPYVDKVTSDQAVTDVVWKDMDEYFNYLERIGISQNLINLSGNGTTRACVRGFKADPLNPEEFGTILKNLEQDMDQGAAGVSFGLQYAPDLFCTPEEVLKVAELVKRKDKIITVHGRAYSIVSGVYPREEPFVPHNVLAIREMVDVAKKTGVRVQYSHLMAAGTLSHPTCKPCLQELENGRADGVDIMTDTYSYHCGTSVINVILPARFQANIQEGFKDEAMIADVENALKRMKTSIGFSLEDIQLGFANHPEFKPFQGKFIPEIAEELKMSPERLVLKLSQATNGRARILNHNYSDMEMMDALISDPCCLFMTDSTVAIEGLQNPASFGTFPLLLQYARDRKLIPLEEAVRKMTGASARRLDIKDRGFLKKGLAADVTVFDWNTIHDNNTIIETDRTPAGIEAVFINGVQVLAESKVNGVVNAGKVLRQ